MLGFFQVVVLAVIEVELLLEVNALLSELLREEVLFSEPLLELFRVVDLIVELLLLFLDVLALSL